MTRIDELPRLIQTEEFEEITEILRCLDRISKHAEKVEATEKEKLVLQEFRRRFYSLRRSMAQQELDAALSLSVYGELGDVGTDP